MHSAGVLHGPDAAPPDVEVGVEEYEFVSTRMGGVVRWAMAAPARAEAVLLCLHGRGANHRFAFDQIGVHRFVARARIPWAVAAVDGGAASYWHRRRTGLDPQAMAFEELLPTITERVGTRPLVLLGWSMGGYGALLAAAEHRDVRAVAVSSPALWRSFASSASGAFDDAADFKANDVYRRAGELRRLPVRIDCGSDDPFASSSRALAGLLPHAEADFGPGFHTSASWRSRVPNQLDFLRRAVSPRA